MSVLSKDQISEEIYRDYGIEGELLDDISDYVLAKIEEHRNLADYEKAWEFYRVWKGGLPVWALGDFVLVFAKICGWEYTRAHTAFVAAVHMGLSMATDDIVSLNKGDFDK